MKNLFVLLVVLLTFLIVSTCSQQGGPQTVKDDLQRNLVGKWQVLEVKTDSDDLVEYSKTEMGNEMMQLMRLMGRKMIWEFHPNSVLSRYMADSTNAQQGEGMEETTYSVRSDSLFISGGYALHEFILNKTELIIKEKNSRYEFKRVE